MDDPEAGNSITMSRPDTPYLIVWEMETDVYYLPESGFVVDQMTSEDLQRFLDDVLLGRSVAYGGNGFLQRIKRFFYDIAMVVVSIYHESVWLALVVFGVPSLVISIICYALCCMETVDEELYDELESSDYAADGDGDLYQKPISQNDNVHKKSD